MSTFTLKAETRKRTFSKLVEQLVGDSTVLAETAPGHPSVVAAVEWAHAVRASHRMKSQPHQRYVDDARDHALDLCRSLLEQIEVQVVADWSVRLGDESEDEIVRPGELAIMLKELVDSLGSATEISPTLLTRLAVETASILISSSRTASLLRSDLELAPREHRSSVGLSATLLPPASDYLVLLGANGASELTGFPASSGFRRIGVGARQGLAAWGQASGKAAEFMRFFGSGGDHPEWYGQAVGPGAFYSSSVRATDAGAAAEIARAAFSAVLDRYVAAHPSVRLTIFDIALVGVGKAVHTHRFGPPPVRSVAPLPFLPRPELAPSMQMNAVARSSPSPVSRVAFSWAALESAGLTPADRERTSKSLALLELRQMVLLSYVDLVRGSRASTETADRYVQLAQRTERLVTRLVAQADSASDSSLALLQPKILQARAKVEAALRLSNIHAAHAGEQRTRLESVGVARAGALHGDTDFARLREFDMWWSNLKELANPNARTDLKTLVDGSEMSTNVRISALAVIASKPGLTRAFLQDRQRHFMASLGAMYSARNMYFHAGQSDISGIVALGRAAPPISDALLELWLLWDSNLNEVSPKAVIQSLSDRFDSIESELRQDGAVSPDLDLGSLNAPAWRS